MKRILVVCTGNICRSPMAEALIRRELESRGAQGYIVESAGTGAWDGNGASEGAYLVSLENGLDLSDHRASLLTPQRVESSDIILTMARHHRRRAEEMGGDGKTYLLGEYAEGSSGGEVSDPFGSDVSVYRETYCEIEELVKAAVDRILESANENSDR